MSSHAIFFELLSLGPGTFLFFFIVIVIVVVVIVIVVGIVICCYFCFAFPGIAANSSGDTGLRIEEWWEMFKNVGEKKKTNKRADGRTDERRGQLNKRTNEGMIEV